MNIFNFESIKNKYDKLSEQKELHLYKIKNIIIDSKCNLEGNCFYYHNTLTIYPDLYNKQVNIFACGELKNSKICEIGFNAGHSTMLMLLGKTSSLKFTIFDIGYHPYTKPCFEYISSYYKNVDFEYIEGDSTTTIPSWIKENLENIGTYDIVHIDGGHSEYCIFNDIKNADILVRKYGLIMIDDTNDEIINKYVDIYLMNNKYIEISILQTYGYKHRIIQKIN